MKASLLHSLRLVLLWAICPILWGSDDRIRVHYNERPPYLSTVAPGIAVGLTATPAAKAFQSAGIPHFWVKTPSMRQMAILKSNAGKDCLVGWFKNPEREQFSRFSQAIYQDKPTIGLALFSNTKIDSGIDIEAAFKNPELTLLVKTGYSYGKYIDELITRLKPNRHSVSVENINMLHMINVNRADYFFTAEEEATGLIESSRLSSQIFKYIRFRNMPTGNKRYILCSLQVHPNIILKLNDWIENQH